MPGKSTLKVAALEELVAAKMAPEGETTLG